MGKKKLFPITRPLTVAFRHAPSANTGRVASPWLAGLQACRLAGSKTLLLTDIVWPLGGSSLLGCAGPRWECRLVNGWGGGRRVAGAVAMDVRGWKG